MPEQLPERPSEQHPIAAGLLALVSVGLVVGLVLGGVVLAGTKVLGIGGDETDVAGDSEASLYIPPPQPTTGKGSPQITLAPDDEKSSDEPSEDPSESESPKPEISVSASSTQVAPMEQFQLTGTYPQGEGAILTVQRFENGRWVDFPATGSVGGEAFQIPVQASLPGVNRFRVVDSDSRLASDEVRVKIG